MSNFEFVFSVFGLVLGFALVEVLGSLGRAIRAKDPLGDAGDPELRIGWLTPMLGLFVMLDLLSFWVVAWKMQEVIPVRYEAMMLGLLFTGAYYLIAMQAVPDGPERTKDFDAYYFAHKKLVLLGILALNAVSIAAETVISTWPYALDLTALLALFAYGLMVAAAFVRGWWANFACLALLLAMYINTLWF